MKIAILGAGNMGGAIAKGLVRSAIPAADIALTRSRPGTPDDLAALGLTATQDNAAAIAHAEVVFVAIKPWAVSAVLQPLASAFAPGATVISVAAGVSLADLKEDLRRAKGVRIVRAMPNTAVGLCCGVTALASEDSEALALAKDLLGRLGLAVAFPEERFGAITALSGCGIAHALRFLRAGQEAGLQMGVPATLAGEIFAQVMKGAAELVLHSGNHPEAEVDRVCTPGGLTIRGINAMERAGFTGAVVEGLLASLPEK